MGNEEKTTKEKEAPFVKATKEGRLYIKTSDFFKQSKIQETIKMFLNSAIIKKIEEERKKEAQQVV